MTDLTFNQLVDVTMVRQLLESHQRLSGMAYGLFDTGGNDIVSVGWQDICVRFHRVHPVTCELCRESNASINSRLHDATDSFVEYRCPNGMIDAAMPLVMDGRHMATFFAGQFFYDDDPPDREFFIDQAAHLGFDVEGYLAALDRAPVLSRRHIRDNMLFLHSMMQILAETGLKNLRLTREMEERKAAQAQLENERLLLRTLIQTIPDPVWLKDPQGVYLAGNGAFALLYGVTPPDLIGTTDYDYVEPDLAAFFQRMDREAMDSGRSRTNEEWVPFADGRRELWETRKTPLYDTDGSVAGVLGVARDISAHRLLEQSLQEVRANLELRIEERTQELSAREREFRALAENTPDNIARWDTAGRILYSNPTHQRTLGKPAVEMIGKTHGELFPDDRYSQIDEAIAHIAATGEEMLVRAPELSKNNETRIHEVKLVPELDEDGAVVSVLGLGRDMTENYRMQETIAAREREFRLLAENSPDAVVRYAPDGRRMYVNPEFERLTGKPAAQLVNETAASAPVTTSSSVNEQLQRTIAGVVREREPKTVEFEWTDKNGDYRCFLNRYVPEFGPSGEVQSVLSVACEISERRRLEKALAAREREFRTLAENLPDNIARYDARCRASYYNARLCRILRLTASPLGKTPMELHTGGEYREYQDILERVLATGEETELDIDDVDAEGREMTHNVRFVAERSANEEITGVLAIGRDITERKRMENELHKKNAELERFAYTVSHDLKSPIVTIRSFSGAIKQDLASGRHDRIEKDLGRISGAADKMGTLLDDLLKLSRSGHVINTPEPVDMARLVDDVLKNLAGDLKKNGVLVTVQPGLPTVMCDRQRMMEVMQNLIENGVKYRGDQPEPRIEIGLREEMGGRVFFVRDNGPGIEPRHHVSIFGLFNRLNTKIPGTGIGLALVKRIIETHGGNIRVESDGQGNGSMFCFTVG